MKLRSGNVQPGRATGAVTASQRAGFSLIELLIVTALIVVMFVLYFNPGAEHYQRRKLVECEKNLHNLYLALELYARDHQEAFPVVTNARTSEEPLSLLVPRYMARTDFFICPGSSDRQLAHGKSFERSRISYAYYMGRVLNRAPAEAMLTDEQAGTGAKATGAAVFSTTGKAPGDNHRQFGGNLLFTDGNVQRLPALTTVALPFPAGVTLLNPR